MSDRTLCVVPFCPKSTKTKYAGQEWICADHWRAVPKRHRRLLAAAKRKFSRHPTDQLAALCDRVWKRCKDEAVVGAAHV